MPDALRTYASWVNGARETLASLEVPSGIVTSTHGNMFEIMDALFEIRSMVGTVVVADDVLPDYKPHPKGLRIACERLGVHPSSCVFIGDQLVDLEAAARAEMDSILIRGTHTPPSLTHTKTVANFTDLAQLLR